MNKPQTTKPSYEELREALEKLHRVAAISDIWNAKELEDAEDILSRVSHD